eukprot:251606_1
MKKQSRLTLIIFIVSILCGLYLFILSSFKSYQRFNRSNYLRCAKDGTPSYPLKNLTQYEIDTFHRDGVVMIKGLFNRQFINDLDTVLEDIADNPSILELFASENKKGYTMSVFLWKFSDFFKDIVFCSPIARIAQQILNASTINVFYDQIFIKDARANAPTPWHQDLTFWDIKHNTTNKKEEGNQIISFWIPTSKINKYDSPLEFVKGSHKWNERFRSVTPTYTPVLMDSNAPFAPNIGGYSKYGKYISHSDYDIIKWDNMEPGDVLLFHPLVLHGADANNNTNNKRRKAYTLRLVGNNVVWNPKMGTMKRLSMFTNYMKTNQKLYGHLYPQILPNRIINETKSREMKPDMPEMRMMIGTVKNVIWSYMKIFTGKIKLE